MEATCKKRRMDLLKAMLDELKSLSPEERVQEVILLRQRLQEMEEEDKREQKSEDEEEKLRIINAKNEAMNTGTLSKVLDFWSQKSKEEKMEYLRKSYERRMREIEERARMEDISNNGGLELLKAMLDNWQSKSPEEKLRRKKLLRKRLKQSEEEARQEDSL